MNTQTVIQGDCLEVMRGFADKSFDLVLCDPPYGIGAEKMMEKGYASLSGKKYEGGGRKLG